jgi:serpin B
MKGDNPLSERQVRYKKASEAINAFAAELYQRVAADEGNLFISPFSVHAALNLALAGAGGETALQMAKVLRWPADPQVPSASAIVLDQIFDRGEDPQQLVTTNALWAQAGLRLHPRAAQLPDGGLRRVDFAGASEEARQAINAWVASQTAGKISDLIGAGMVDALTRLILTNATYFKADWREKFDPDDTADAPFHLADGTNRRVPMMHQVEDFRAIEHERYWAVNLLYEGFHMSMQLFVPRRIEDLPWLENTVLARHHEEWQQDMEWRHVNLKLPRFRLETSQGIGKVLAGMEMQNAFDETKADFSGLTPDPFWLSGVIHQAYVDVNEEGTEAAGATAAVLCAGIGGEYEPLVVTVDRPFLFTISGHSSYLLGEPLLFIGRVWDPDTDR